MIKVLSVLALLVLSVPSISFANTKKEIVNGGKLVFQVNDDIELEKLRLEIKCMRDATIWEQGSNGGEKRIECDSMKVNGKAVNYATQLIELKNIGRNIYVLDLLEIEYPTKRNAELYFTFGWQASIEWSTKSYAVFVTANAVNEAISKPIIIKAVKKPTYVIANDVLVKKSEEVAKNACVDKGCSNVVITSVNRITNYRFDSTKEVWFNATMSCTTGESKGLVGTYYEMSKDRFNGVICKPSR